MKKIVPLQNYSREVQIMAHMIGLNNKRPYVRHGRRYYKPYRSYFCAALSGPDYEALRALERRGLVESGRPGEKTVYFWTTRDGLDWTGWAASSTSRSMTRRINTRKEIHMKVNTELLQKKIKDSGLKMGFIAEKLGRSRQALSDKIKGETEFLPSEIRVLCELLRLTDEERRLIFLI